MSACNRSTTWLKDYESSDSYIATSLAFLAVLVPLTTQKRPVHHAGPVLRPYVMDGNRQAADESASSNQLPTHVTVAWLN